MNQRRRAPADRHGLSASRPGAPAPRAVRRLEARAGCLDLEPQHLQRVAARAAPAGGATCPRPGPCLRGRGSSTRPPPIVSGGASWRSTKRSPATATSGRSRRSCASPALPGSSSSPSSGRDARGRLARAVVDVHAGAPRAAAARPASSRTSTSSRYVRPPVLPRRRRPRRRAATSLRSTPARLSATRWPGLGALARARRAPPPRARARARRRARSGPRRPRATLPDHSVPVTTVPMPCSVKLRSTCSRGGPPRPGSARSGSRSARRAARAARRGPVPRAALTRHHRCARVRAAGQQLAPPRPRAARAPRASDEVGLGERDDARRAPRAAPAPPRARGSGASRRRPPRRRAGRGRCRSRPATIVRTKRSCPGTSTTLSDAPGRQRPGGRSRARSRCRARAPPAGGRCRRPSAPRRARSCRDRCGRRCRA